MAQAPAVPKLLRARHLIQAHISKNTQSSHGLVPSEKAALELRAINPLQQTARQVTFLIPMVGAAQVGDWQAVSDRLTTTLKGFLRQENPNWQAIVCGQDKPDLPTDSRIAFVPFTDTTPGNDKWRKLRVLYDTLHQRVSKPGYVMSFDADDLLHPAAVSEMLTRQKPGGYLVQSGLVMDVSGGDIALADTRSITAPMRKPFWKLCGSCAALYHDPVEPASTAFLAEMTQHEHRMFPYLAALAGQSLHTLTFPSVLYMLNHGENFGARRGRVNFKTRFVQRYKITEATRLSEIRRDFGLAT